MSPSFASQYATFIEEYQRTVQGRVLYLAFVYSFGATKKDKPANFG
jgi:hypothetical protein